MIGPIEKVRNWAEKPIVVVDVRCNDRTAHLSATEQKRLKDMLDSLEEDMAEHYTELPKGSDGEPIKLNDDLFSDGCGRFKCIGFKYDGAWSVLCGDGVVPVWIPSGQCKHYRHRKVEDVLHDFALECEESGFKGPDVTKLIDRFSNELRMVEE